MDATIVDDALHGYELKITYDGKRFLAVATDEQGTALTATYARHEWSMDVAARPIPLRSLVERINSWLQPYTRSRLLMPEDMLCVGAGVAVRV